MHHLNQPWFHVEKVRKGIKMQLPKKFRQNRQPVSGQRQEPDEVPVPVNQNSMGRQCVYCHTMLVSNIFSAEEIYNPASRTSASQTSLKAFIESTRLSDRPIWTDYIVYVSERLLIDEKRNYPGSRHGSRLTEDLEKRISHDFPDTNGKEVVVKVVGHESLAPNCVIIVFGPAIYHRRNDAEDPTAFKLRWALSPTVGNWSAPVYCYAKQHLLLLGNDIKTAGVCDPGWPLATTLAIDYDTEDHHIEMSFEGQDAATLLLEKREDIEQWVVTKKDDECFVLYLEIEQYEIPKELPVVTRSPRAPVPAPVQHLSALTGVAMPPFSPPANSMTTPPAQQAPGQVPTFVPGRPVPQNAPPGQTQTWVPTGQHGKVPKPPPVMGHLELVGIALQHPSGFPGHNIQAVCLGVDKNGTILPPDDPGCFYLVQLDAGGELSIRNLSVPQSRTALVRAGGPKIPYPKGVLEFHPVPGAISSIYACIMTGIRPVQYPLTEHAQLNAGREDASDLKPLQVLSGSGFLQGCPNVSGDTMGMSRQHLELVPENGRLLVRVIGQVAVSVLDENFRLKQQLAKGEETLLEPGDCICFSHYMWQFSA